MDEYLKITLITKSKERIIFDAIRPLPNCFTIPRLDREKEVYAFFCTVISGGEAGKILTVIYVEQNEPSAKTAKV